MQADAIDVRFRGQSGHRLSHRKMSPYDPKRTKADADGLSAMCPNSCRQLGLLDQLVGARDEPDLHQCRERDIFAPAT